MTFRDAHPELQHLVREWRLLREHNKQFAVGDNQAALLLFAEGAVALVTLERFVRIALGKETSETDTLYNLLEKAVSKRLLHLPWENQADGIRKLKDVRNTILHGNFEQAAIQAGCADVPVYFATQFVAEVEELYRLGDYLFRQIDPETGSCVLGRS